MRRRCVAVALMLLLLLAQVGEAAGVHVHDGREAGARSVLPTEHAHAAEAAAREGSEPEEAPGSGPVSDGSCACVCHAPATLAAGSEAYRVGALLESLAEPIAARVTHPTRNRLRFLLPDATAPPEAR